MNRTVRTKHSCTYTYREQAMPGSSWNKRPLGSSVHSATKRAFVCAVHNTSPLARWTAWELCCQGSFRLLFFSSKLSHLACSRMDMEKKGQTERLVGHGRVPPGLSLGHISPAFYPCTPRFDSPWILWYCSIYMCANRLLMYLKLGWRSKDAIIPLK